MFHDLRQKEQPRTFTRLPRLATASILAWMLAPPIAYAQNSPARSPLTAAEVIAAMQDRQLPTSGIQVRLAVPITSLVLKPTLEIEDVTPLNQHDVRLRMACRNRSECLPFFAVATYSEPIDSRIFQVRAVLRSTTLTTPSPAAKTIADTSSPSSPVKPINSGGPPVIRSGTPATLDIDGDRIHVRVEVICLESGAIGDKIRVTTRDYKQVYTAEIVAPKALKGTLTR